MEQSIGVAGLGAMGLPMAKRLINHGFKVWGFDIRPAHDFRALDDAFLSDAGDFARLSDTVISVVRDARQTMDLLFDAQAIMAVDGGPKRLVICSTLSPRILPDIAARLGPGRVLLDAPMSGAPHGARMGTLTFMVGGDIAEVNHLRAALQTMGDIVHHLGPLGAGMTVKVLNNFVAAAGVVAVRRALGVADELGVPRKLLLDVMRTSSGATWYGNNMDRISWAGDGFGADTAIGLLEKDVSAFVDAAAGAGIGSGGLEATLIAELQRMEPLK